MAFSSPQHNQAQSTLMNLPLELRHRIYDELNFRGKWEERQVFRDYLNIIDPQHSNGDDAPQTFDDEDGDVHMMVADEDDASDVEQVEDEEMTDEDDEEDQDEDDDEDEEGEGETEGNYHEEQQGVEQGDGAEDEGAFATGEDATPIPAATATAVADHTAPAATTTVARPPRPITKYRHAPNLIYLSACPPSTNALLSCQRVYEEAKDHYYKSNALFIEATKSFQHFTFFEETLHTIADAAFSPLESLRKINIRIVWDSAYVNELANAADPTDTDYERLLMMRGLLEDTLQLRMSVLSEVLEKATGFRELTVEIFDSLSGPEQVVFTDDLLERLQYTCLSKGVEMQVKQHRLEEGQLPKRRSVIGKFRAELKQVVENHQEFR